MKVSEYHNLIGKPVFNVGDRVIIKDLDLECWVSHIQIQHLLRKYHYMVVNADDEMIKGRGLFNGFLSDELEILN